MAGSSFAGKAAPTVTTRLPLWLAPGASFTVSGFAGSRRPVILDVGGTVIGRTTSGPLGRYAIHAKAPAAGTHRLSVQSAGSATLVGTLLTRPVVIAAVGDVTPGEAVGPAILGRGATYPWGEVGAVLRNADIATANLEGAVSSRGVPVPDKQYHFEGPVGLLRGARTFAGLDVVTLANNHVMDYGAVALADTLAAAHRAGILTVGAGGNEAAAHRAAVLIAGGLRVAFLGYSDINPLGFVATATSPGTARATIEAITADVRAARRRSDIVVCWFHWGVEGTPSPNGDQRLLAHAALAAGAAIVLGAHPHVLGPVERPSPRTVVAWTLGNFVFPATSAATTRTGILLVSVSAAGVGRVRLVPASAGVRPTLG